MWCLHDGVGWRQWFPGIFNLLSWAVLIGLIVWVVNRVTHRGRDAAHGPEKQDALEIARLRYARGEITKEQFDQIKKDLTTP